MEKEEFIGSLLVYSRHLDDIKEALKELNEEKIDVTVESCERCIANLQSCMLDTLQQSNPNLVLIENDSSCNGLILYKMIKDEGTLKDISVIFIGSEGREEKLDALKMGALDYLTKPFDKEELIIKIKNYIELGKKLITHSIYDMLTGAYSRKYGEESARKEFAEAKSTKRGFATLVWDMDNMSLLNFYLGKAAGDNILKECVDIFSKSLGTLDFIYRFSGEKFIVVFPDKSTEQIKLLADNALSQVEALTNKYNMKISFTGAIGDVEIATVEYEDFIHSIISHLENGKLKQKGKIYTAENTELDNVKPRLLIINEDNVILSILGSRYKSKGYEVFTTDNIETALNIIGDNKVYLIITDYMLSGTTGIEIIKKLKAINKQSKVMILSSQKSEYIVETALNNGADDYVVKPFSPVELDSRIKKLLG